jgi:tetrahydromethanopterin S-methyltransferase subunit F
VFFRADAKEPEAVVSITNTSDWDAVDVEVEVSVRDRPKLHEKTQRLRAGRNTDEGPPT